ncbi:RES domain-containing protein [Cytophaga aurantiaca]|uniref:RES domain-containing protein n=1 Tax=Cytophaga aurantiaca TaxID=29530 RepID=UPI00036EFA89|nr:RES domain-containing protein [Cytophaga aurantiaca]
MQDKQSFDISVHTEEQVEQIFSQIVSSCNELQNHSEIQKIITKSLGGGIILIWEFHSKSHPLKIYRVTPISDADWFQIDQKSTYSYPPKPEIGRANIKDEPVFYASLDIITAIREMKNKLTAGNSFFVSEWKFIPKKTIYAHCLILNSTTQSSEDQILYELADNHASQLEKLFNGTSKSISKGMAHAVRKMGDLFTIPGSSKYNITSAYAHGIIYEARKQNAYMPILIYPSVENHHEGINFAIHPELIQNESVELQRVFKFFIPSECDLSLKEFDNLQITERGIYKKSIMEWQILRASSKIGDKENVCVKTENGEFIRGENVLKFKFISSGNTIDDFIQRELKSDTLASIIGTLAEEQEIEDSINYQEKESEEIFIIRLPNKTIVETDLGQITIVHIEMPVSWSQAYCKKS